MSRFERSNQDFHFLKYIVIDERERERKREGGGEPAKSFVLDMVSLRYG